MCTLCLHPTLGCLIGHCFDPSLFPVTCHRVQGHGKGSGNVQFVLQIMTVPPLLGQSPMRPFCAVFSGISEDKSRVFGRCSSFMPTMSCNLESESITKFIIDSCPVAENIPNKKVFTEMKKKWEDN